MYTGFILLLLPMIISNWPQSLNLSYAPQTFDFESDLSSIISVHGTPTIVAFRNTASAALYRHGLHQCRFPSGLGLWLILTQGNSA